MKILHMFYSFITGGAETMLVDITNEQVKSAEVSLVIINNIFNQEIIDKLDQRIRVIKINREAGNRSPWPILKLNLVLLKLNADVYHCHDHNIISTLLPYFRKKAVLTVHDVGFETDKFNLYNKLFSISKSVKADLEQRFGLTSILVYNGIKLNTIQVKELMHSTDQFKIVIVSRLRHYKKGQHFVIEALNLLANKGVFNFYVDFIGEEIIKGESIDFLKSLVSKYKLENNIRFLGHKNREYVYSHLCDYDLLIQPSLFEGFGLTVTEGMAAKVPVLVSDVDGPMEIIENGQYGSFFQSGNSEQLAEKILNIYNSYNSIESKQKVEDAYLHVKSNFDIKTTARKYLDNY